MGMDAFAASAFSAQTGMAQGRAQAALAAGGRGATSEAATREAAEKFEAVFISQMFGHMFSGLGSDSLFGGGQGEEMFRSLLVDEYAKLTVKKGGIGIADSVMRTLIAQQEKA